MERLFALFGDFTDPRVGGADSFTDRMNCSYTTFLLGMFAVLVSTIHYASEPVSCWAPAHFTDAHEEYANRVGMKWMGG